MGMLMRITPVGHMPKQMANQQELFSIISERNLAGLLAVLVRGTSLVCLLVLNLDQEILSKVVWYPHTY